MVNERIGICDRFQQEMKYHCNRMAGRFLTGAIETRSARSIQSFHSATSIHMVDDASGRSLRGDGNILGSSGSCSLIRLRE